MDTEAETTVVIFSISSYMTLYFMPKILSWHYIRRDQFLLQSCHCSKYTLQIQTPSFISYSHTRLFDVRFLSDYFPHLHSLLTVIHLPTWSLSPNEPNQMTFSNIVPSLSFMFVMYCIPLSITGWASILALTKPYIQ